MPAPATLEVTGQPKALPRHPQRPRSALPRAACEWLGRLGLPAALGQRVEGPCQSPYAGWLQALRSQPESAQAAAAADRCAHTRVVSLSLTHTHTRSTHSAHLRDKGVPSRPWPHPETRRRRAPSSQPGPASNQHILIATSRGSPTGPVPEQPSALRQEARGQLGGDSPAASRPSPRPCALRSRATWCLMTTLSARDARRRDCQAY